MIFGHDKINNIRFYTHPNGLMTASYFLLGHIPLKARQAITALLQ